jgi:hypothetical protein
LSKTKEHFPFAMQLSIKTPPDLTVRLLEKCSVLGERFPSSFAMTCAWQCLREMNSSRPEFRPLEIVDRYYYAAGREIEIHFDRQEHDEFLREMAEKSQARRTEKTARRLEEFHAELERQPPPRHLHLKISQGIDNLPARIKEKALWLRISPNALVISCLRYCLDAMDDPETALGPPGIVQRFWVVSHTKSRRKAKDAIDGMMMRKVDEMLRQRTGPIIDTVVRFSLCEEWDTPLWQILRDADVLSDEWMSHDSTSHTPS